MASQLRPMKIDDLELIRAWRNHDNVRKFMFSQRVINSDAHQKWFKKANNDSLHKLFIFEDHADPIGFTQLKTKDNRLYEWGFYTSPDAEKGSGTRMLKLVIQQAFHELRATKLYGEVLGFNRASIKLHEKLGFTQEGVLREHVFLNQAYQDVYCFGLLQSEIV